MMKEDLKRNLLLYCTLAAISIGFGAWLRARMSVSFTGFEGQFTCSDFGLPDKNYNVMRFTPRGEDTVIVESLFKSQTSEVGRLKTQSSSLARLDLATSLYHSPNLTLNPLAEHFVEGKGRTIFIVGRQDGKELYRHSCTK